MSSDLREKLAELEHDQWMHWSQYVAENYDIPEELEEKWGENWEDYDNLSEEMKDKDRKWADKVLDILDEEFEELSDEEAWYVVENLMWTYRETKDEDIEEILDKISDNWKSADSGKDVELNQVKVITD